MYKIFILYVSLIATIASKSNVILIGKKIMWFLKPKLRFLKLLEEEQNTIRSLNLLYTLCNIGTGILCYKIVIVWSHR